MIDYWDERPTPQEEKEMALLKKALIENPFFGVLEVTPITDRGNGNEQETSSS